MERQPADKMDDPYELGLRVEHLLSVTNTQRSLHIARLSSRNDVRKATHLPEEEYQTRVAYTTDKVQSAVGDSGFTLMQNTEEDPLMAAATKYAAAQIESEVDGKCCPMQKQSSAPMKKKAI